MTKPIAPTPLRRRRGARARGERSRRQHVLRLHEVTSADADRVGIEAASLGEAIRRVGSRGVHVPDGFVTTTDAYEAFLATPVPSTAWSTNGTPPLPHDGRRWPSPTLGAALRTLLAAEPAGGRFTLGDRCATVRRLCFATPVPDAVRSAVAVAYGRLRDDRDGESAVALRATTALHPHGEAPSDGWHEGHLEVRGVEAVLDAWRRCVASAYTERAVAHRLERGMDPCERTVCVIVSRIGARAASGARGLVSTLDPDSGNGNVLLVTVCKAPGASNGPGPASSESYLVWKEGLRRGRCTVVRRRKESETPVPAGAEIGDAVVVPAEAWEPDGWSLRKDEIAELARIALLVEEHWGQPMEIGWARDGASGTLSLVQVLPSIGRATDPRAERSPPWKLRTAVKLDLDVLDDALHEAMLPSDGVGLARVESFLRSEIGIHPLAVAHYAALASFARSGRLDPRLAPCAGRLRAAGRERLIGLLNQVRRSMGAVDPPSSFVERLRDAIGLVCAAFHPRPVLVSLSDFTSEQYRRLIGGDLFEPEEENPVIAWRGAARHVDPRFRPAFDLECRALAAVPRQLGLDNLQLLVPFCRTPEEGRVIARLLAEHGLCAECGVPVKLMVELPTNVILAERFIDEMQLSGGSIGTSALVQTVYALSRADLESYGAAMSARSGAARLMIRQAIDAFRSRGLHIGVCGQVPSDDPREMATFLMDCGVTSISTTVDALHDVREAIRRREMHARISDPEGVGCPDPD